MLGDLPRPGRTRHLRAPLLPLELSEREEAKGRRGRGKRGFLKFESTSESSLPHYGRAGVFYMLHPRARVASSAAILLPIVLRFRPRSRITGLKTVAEDRNEEGEDQDDGPRISTKRVRASRRRFFSCSPPSLSCFALTEIANLSATISLDEASRVIRRVYALISGRGQSAARRRRIV